MECVPVTTQVPYPEIAWVAAHRATPQAIEKAPVRNRNGGSRRGIGKPPAVCNGKRAIRLLELRNACQCESDARRSPGMPYAVRRDVGVGRGYA
jgi:hypothetical protein